MGEAKPSNKGEKRNKKDSMFAVLVEENHHKVTANVFFSLSALLADGEATPSKKRKKKQKDTMLFWWRPPPQSNRKCFFRCQRWMLMGKPCRKTKKKKETKKIVCCFGGDHHHKVTKVFFPLSVLRADREAKPSNKGEKRNKKDSMF